MNRKIYVVVCLIAVAFLWSCSKDDEVNPESTILIYGRPYNLTSGVIWESNPYVIKSVVPYVFHDVYMKNGMEVEDLVEGFAQGESEEVYGNFMLSLYEPGLTFNEALNQVTGSAACICFHLSSAETGHLVPGKYVYGADKKANTFVAYLSSSYNTEKEVIPAELIEGEINVEQRGEKYEVTFNCKTGSGGETSGSYVGELKKSRVKQQLLAFYEDITLAGLLDSVKNFASDNVTFSYSLDTYGAAYFSTKTGACIRAQDGGKENVDVALVWNRTKEAFYFESPIRMRALTGHNDAYNFPCHTIYMKAPASFTEADFERLEETGFQFDVVEEKVEVEAQSTLEAKYVFFLTGNGTKGVIRAKRYNPISWQENWFFGMFYLGKNEVNPSLVIDVKCSSDFLNPQIR